jgi:hypothetical protein
MIDRIAVGGLVACVGVVALCGLANAIACGEVLEGDRYTLANSLDAYSEAGVIRAAERFASDGFAVTYGLPDVAYGPRFPRLGLTGPSGPLAGETVYHGDPPGTYWIAGALYRPSGDGVLRRMRMAPIAVAVVATGTFAWALARTMGPTRALIVLVLCLSAPMFTNMSHSLYYHGYGLSLLLMQIAVLVRWFASGGLARPVPYLTALGVIGFTQGWLSYAYCGVVTFAAVPIALLLTPAGRPVPWARLLAAVAAPGAAFVAAHGLHFGQSLMYYGNFDNVIDEYIYRSNKIYWLEAAGVDQGSPWTVRLFGMRELIENFGRWTHLGGPVAFLVAAATLAAIVVRRLSVAIRPGWRVEVVSSVTSRQAIGTLAALAAACVWAVLKPHHMIAHKSVTGRAMFLPYVCCAILLATALEVRFRASPHSTGETAA